MGIASRSTGEGLNLQRAHLMVTYDLPWNPNKIEQRFGRQSWLSSGVEQLAVDWLWAKGSSST